MALFFFNKKPTKSEEQKVAKGYKEADPATYSSLSPSDLEQVDTNHYGYAVVRDTHGNRYVDVTEKWGETGATERVVALILKGIVNVSDLVRVQGESGVKYYSKVMEVEKTKDATMQEMQADLALIHILFKDVDHSFEGRDGGDHNLIRDKSKKKIFFFDFGSAMFGFWVKNIEYGDSLEDLDSFAVHTLVEKLQTLQTHISGAEGTQFLQNIINESGKSVSELFIDTPTRDSKTPFQVFHDELLSRIENALDVATQTQNSFKKVA